MIEVLRIIVCIILVFFVIIGLTGMIAVLGSILDELADKSYWSRRKKE